MRLALALSFHLGYKNFEFFPSNLILISKRFCYCFQQFILCILDLLSCVSYGFWTQYLSYRFFHALRTFSSYENAMSIILRQCTLSCVHPYIREVISVLKICILSYLFSALFCKCCLIKTADMGITIIAIKFKISLHAIFLSSLYPLAINGRPFFCNFFVSDRRCKWFC